MQWFAFASERIPWMASLLVGKSAIDQSPVTGSCCPKKCMGMRYAGTINRATAEIRDGNCVRRLLLARIIHAVEQAQTSRTPDQHFIDHVLPKFTRRPYFLAVTVAIVAPWAMGLDRGLDALYKALGICWCLSLCFFVISAPVGGQMNASAARAVFLIKGGVYLEAALWKSKLSHWTKQAPSDQTSISEF